MLFERILRFRRLLFFFRIDLRVTFILTIEYFNSSTSIFKQYFKYNGSIQIDFIVSNSSLSSSSPYLRFDLWLPFNRGLLRTYLTEFPHQSPLYINFIYRSPLLLSIFLYGQLINSTTDLIYIQSNKPAQSSSLSFNIYVPFHSISWSYQRQASGRPFL